MILMFHGCSFMPERSYSDLMEETNEYYVPDRDFAIAVGDSGQRYQDFNELMSRTPAGLDENDSSIPEELKEKYQLQRELASVEQRQPPVFQEMYWLHKDDFRNDSERIYFLTLPSIRDREQYLTSRGMKPADERPRYVSDLISKDDHREILTGMSPVQVRKIAGNPTFVESSSPEGNGRWAYKLPNYRVRYIYFDQGSVNGWSEEVSP